MPWVECWSGVIFALTIGEVIGAWKPDVNDFPEWTNSCVAS